MTLSMMRTFGVDATCESDPKPGELLNVYHIPKATYQSPKEYSIKSDASSATYPLAIAAITGTKCTIGNIGTASLQGNAWFAIDVLCPTGCEVIQIKTEMTVREPPVGTLRALGYVDMEPMTDAFLTATVLAAVATGKPLEGRELTDGSSKKTMGILGIANQ